MSWFRRKDKADVDVDATVDETPSPAADLGSEENEIPDSSDESAVERSTTDDADDADQTGKVSADAEARRLEHGPLDLSEADPDERRIDLGALQLPGRQGMELRLEVEDSTKRVIAVTVAMSGSSLQMQAFAAPRTFGVWDDVRGEIAAQVTRQGGTADEVPGTFGRELIARIPVRTPDGRSGHQPSRFVGVDGPRWFLRGVFGGPAAHDHDAAAPLEDVLRSAVVVRGAEAMAPRDLLALRLPSGATPPAASAGVETADAQADAQAGAQAGAQAAAPARSKDDLAPFERGPEITERR